MRLACAMVLSSLLFALSASADDDSTYPELDERDGHATAQLMEEARSGGSYGSSGGGDGLGFLGFLAASSALFVVGAFMSVFAAIGAMFWLAALWCIFEKAGRSGVLALIPVANLWTLLRVCGRPGWLVLIPFVNVIALGVFVPFWLAKRFERSSAFAFGLLVFGVLFYPLLGFGPYRYAPAGSATGWASALPYAGAGSGTAG